MKIGILGDSHNQYHYLDLAVEKLKDVDLIIHTGDHYHDIKYIEKKHKIKTIGVKGNCDTFGVEELTTTFGGKRFFICHGHMYGVKSRINSLFYRGKEIQADVAVFGHTHIPFYMVEENMVLVNPGSVAYPRGGSKKSCSKLEINNDIRVDIITLE